MSYTAQSMMADAEKLFAESKKLADKYPTHSIACALQGLLACKLAEYAGDVIVGPLDGEWVPGDPVR